MIEACDLMFYHDQIKDIAEWENRGKIKLFACNFHEYQNFSFKPIYEMQFKGT